MNDVTELRPLPVNLEAEKALLGAIFYNNAVLSRVSDFLKPAHFSEPLHQLIYDSAVGLVRSGEPSAANSVSILAPMSFISLDMPEAREVCRKGSSSRICSSV